MHLLAAATVVLLSIDGLKPDYVLDADAHGLRIPHLRSLVTGGVYATSVRGVFPSVTYPSHTTMITGVSPDKHGIYDNHPFDPFDKNMGGWTWYYEDVRVPSLWDVVEDDASVDWPVSVGADIRYNIAQYWRAGTPDDRKLIRALSTPGLLTEAEAALGPYPDGNDYGLEADRTRTRFIEYLLSNKAPRFLTGYLAALDTEQHASGPYSQETFETLEAIDELVGRLKAEADVLCVVSDHGFLPSETELHVNAALHEAGLIELSDEGRVTSWRAIAWNFGGAAAIVLDDPSLREEVEAVIETLTSDPANGIETVTTTEAERIPGAAFVVSMKSGFRVGDSLSGSVLSRGEPGGTHGYVQANEAMSSAFFLAGAGIPEGLALGRIDMRDIAPTLAAILEVSLPSADGRNLLND